MLALPLLTVVAVPLARTPRQADAVNVVGALGTAGVALALAVSAIVRADSPARGAWYVLDAASGVFLAVIAVVGLLSALVSPLQLAGQGRGLVPAARARTLYYVAFHSFWAALLAIPARRQPRDRVAAGGGDHRRLGAAGRLQRQAQRARSRLEVPGAHDVRARRRAARHHRALRARRRLDRPPGDAGLAIDRRQLRRLCRRTGR